MKKRLSPWWLAAILLILPQLSLAETYFVQDNWHVIGSQSIQPGDTAIIKAGNQITFANDAILTVEANAKLIVEPGVNFKMGTDSRILIKGQLIAEGTPTKTINFSSSLTTPNYDSWLGLYSHDKGQVKLRYTRLQHAGTAILTTNNYTSNSIALDIQYSYFENNLTAIHIDSDWTENIPPSLIRLSINNFENNRWNISLNGSLTYNPAIDAKHNWWQGSTDDKVYNDNYSNIDVSQPRYSENFPPQASQNNTLPSGLAIRFPELAGVQPKILLASTAVVSTTEAGLIGISWPESYLIDDTYLLNSSQNLTSNIDISSSQIVRVTAGTTLTVMAGNTLTIAKGGQLILEQGATLVLEDGANIINSGITTIEAGVDIKAGADAKITVHGQLIAEGTSEEQISFSSSLDEPATTSWIGIWIEKSGYARLRHINIQHASYAIELFKSNSTQTPTLDVQYSHFQNNGIAVNISQINDYVTGNISLNYNNFINNDLNINTYTKVSNLYIVDARYNWWGTTNLDQIISAINIWAPNSNIEPLKVDYGLCFLNHD